ncbi:MAG: hypothetical protein HQL50_03590 [Magnetococcales bacterium]|nr:hypothetical protein [Magnetococcales bacterium]
MPNTPQFTTGWKTLLLVVLLVLVPPALVGRTFYKPPFDDSDLKKLKQIQPDIVFIGNSLLESRIDPDYLGELLGGKSVFTLYLPGGRSTIWYLQLKNYLIASKVQPEAVFIMFKDTQLTKRMRWLMGMARYRRRVSEKSHEHEPFLEGMLAQHQSIQESSHDFLFRKVYPIQIDGTESMKWYLKRLALMPTEDLGALFTEVAAKLTGKPSSKEAHTQAKAHRERVLAHSDKMFDLVHLKPVAYAAEPELEHADYDFEKVLATSYLPEILRLAKENAIPLRFIRVKNRPTPEGDYVEPEGLREYGRDMESYLRIHSVPLLSFTTDPAIQLHHFRDGDHIDRAWRPWWTERFAALYREGVK